MSKTINEIKYHDQEEANILPVFIIDCYSVKGWEKSQELQQNQTTRIMKYTSVDT